MRLVSDKARRWVLPVLVGLLLVDGVAWSLFKLDGDTGYTRCMDAGDQPPELPGPCTGEQVVLPLQQVLQIDGPDRFQVGRLDGRIWVTAPSAGLRLGQELTVGGLRTQEGLEANLVQAHPLRPWKQRLGLMGMVLLGLVSLAAFTVRRTQVGWRVVPRG